MPNHALEFSARAGSATALRTDCLIVPVPGRLPLPAATAAIDAAMDGQIGALVEAGDFTGTLGATLMLHQPAGLTAARLLLVGTGKEPPLPRDILGVLTAAARAVQGTPAKQAALLVTDLLGDRDPAAFARHTARLFCEAGYKYRSGDDNGKRGRLARLTLLCDERGPARPLTQGAALGAMVGAAVNGARRLGDLPGNVCTPGYLVEQARELSKRHPGVHVRVLDEKQMTRLKMGALLSVTAGSAQPAYLIALEYRGAAGQAPVVLVGKGVTFDSGGISLKPGAKMDEMKYDMCGAASVLGVMEAVAAAALPLHLVCLVPTVENLPSGTATRPGDVVTAMSGKTIEILNTDAEGRLILCDALTYAARYKPAVVIDIATLTGACVVALGKHASGLFSPSDTLAADLLAAGEASGDRAWRLPLWKEYDEQLKSNFADVANVGGPEAGSITGGCFLARFTKDYTWAHLDIAGTAWNSSPKGATGRPIPLLMEYLLGRLRGADKA